MSAPCRLGQETLARLAAPMLLALSALLTTAAVAQAQIVRGVVTERTSGLPLSGVLVTLERADTTTAQRALDLSALTNERGEYAIRATAPGRYRVDAKRIGVRRFTSPPVMLAEGQTERVDLVVDGLLFLLPEVTVEAAPVCAVRRNQSQRVAALWDEAWTALTATRVSARDRPTRAQVVRHVLTIDLENTASLGESHMVLENAMERPFRSLSADSLSSIGWWREMPGDSVEYYGPDAEALLSDAFRRDHCYSVTEGGRERRGLIGLSFQPVEDRTLPDVRGTLWMDARTFELRFVEFEYSRLPYGEIPARVGGEVHFARMPNGAWVVRRWYIRVPTYRRSMRADSAAPILRAALDSLATLHRLVEEGGSLIMEGLPQPDRPASLRGVVQDSTGGPMRGATVRLTGTPYVTAVDERGRFAFDSLPPGTYAVVALHDEYNVFGLTATQAFLSLSEGDREEITLRALRMRQIRSRLCEAMTPAPRHATLRVVVVDSATNVPLGNVPFRLSWSDPTRGGTLAFREQERTAYTDRTGGANFCDLPPAVPIELAIARDDGEPLRVMVLQLRANELATRLVFARTAR
ncbi:MAG TPA: carboxypeptidase-like regulatory domain-containing protein [Gemmatimonadaceae bacterium]|nr:carboxypeptidase-like regulatory domain-containing protein [Gemmatimonadaceae bacterium]